MSTEVVSPKDPGRPLPTEITAIRDEKTGRAISVYMRLRPGKARCATQPNKKALVFFYLGADSLPVGIQFLEPAVGVPVSYMLRDFITENGAGPSVGHRYLMTPEEIRDFVREMSKAEGKVEALLANS